MRKKIAKLNGGERNSGKGEKFSPFLSVIVPVFNGAKTLEASLKAIYKSGYTNFELIVVDDGSIDNSVEIAKKFPCRIIEKKQNTGPGESRNIGAKLAKGEILFFTDADCIVKPDTISQIIKSFRKGVDIVAGTYSKTPLNNERIFTNYHSLFCYYNYTNSSVVLFGTQCAAIKKKLFIKLGGFDRCYNTEDLRFQYKLQDMGYKYDINMNAQVFHDSRNSFITLIKGYYSRSKHVTQLLLKLLFELKKTKPSKDEYIYNYKTILSYLSLMSFLIFLILIFFNKYFVFFSIFSLDVFLVSRLKFYGLAGKKQLIKVIGLNIICDIIILWGSMAGVMSYTLNKRELV